MGERHQIYVKLPKKFYNKENGNNKRTCVIGIYHSSIWGHTAIRLLKNLVEYYQKSDQYCPLKYQNMEMAKNLLYNIYSTNISQGYYHHNTLLNKEECTDPEFTTNNTGITVIDLTTIGTLKYCFMSLNGIEGKEQVKTFTPLTATEYLLAYYPDFFSLEKRDEEDIILVKEIGELLNYIADHSKLLTVKQVHKIFPKAKFVKDYKAAQQQLLEKVD